MMYLQCLHYRTINQQQKRFQDRSSVIEAKHLSENLIYVSKNRDFLFADVAPSLKTTTICKNAQNYVSPTLPPLWGHHK